MGTPAEISVDSSSLLDPMNTVCRGSAAAITIAITRRFASRDAKKHADPQLQASDGEAN